MRRLPRLNPILPFEEDAAGPGSKSILKGGHEDPGRALEWVAAFTQSPRTTTNPLVSKRQDGPQFPLHPYTLGQVDWGMSRIVLKVG
jgi:hypothetical protein